MALRLKYLSWTLISLLRGGVALGGDGAAAQTLSLKGDIIAVAEVPAAGGQSRLAVLTADQTRPIPKHKIVWLKKQDGHLSIGQEQALDAEDYAFDVCRLRGAEAAAEVLTLRPTGVYRLGASQPLAAAETLFAQPSDDLVPRVRLCFPLFSGEGEALVVPTLSSLQVFRTADRGESYRAAARLPTTANASYSWSSTALRGEQLRSTQLVAVRFDFPAVTVLDFNADGRADLCLSRGESLQCYLQDATGFQPGQQKTFFFPVRSDAERQQQSVRVVSQLVELVRGTLPAYVVSKTEWNLSDMRTTSYIFRQAKGGGFNGKPAQTIARKGYFALQEFLDLEGEGRKDLIAPVAALGWSDLMQIYVAKSADIAFIRYKNQGDGFATTPEELYTLSLPVDFKHLGSVLGALPLWQIRLAKKAPAAGHDVAFFPGKEAVELMRLQKKDGGVNAQSLVRIPAAIGAEVLAVDLDGDGVDELILFSPHEPGLEKKIALIELKDRVP